MKRGPSPAQMKRVGRKESSSPPPPQQWCVAPHTAKVDHIKEAVAAARYNKDSDTHLSRKPILLRCVGEDVSCHVTLVYWPYTIATGELLLRRLGETKTTTDIVRHCELVETLIGIATNPDGGGAEMSPHETLKRRRLALDSLDMTSLGVFALIRHTDYMGYDPESNEDDDGNDASVVFHIEMHQLDTHLYQQECLRFT